MMSLSPKWLLSTLLLLLCVLAQQGSTSVICPLPSQPISTDNDGPPLTADDIARGIQALSKTSQLSEAQIGQINKTLANATELRARVSKLQSSRGQLQMHSAIIATELLESQ